MMLSMSPALRSGRDGAHAGRLGDYDIVAVRAHTASSSASGKPLLIRAVVML